MNLLVWKATESSAGSGFPATDQALGRSNGGKIHLGRLLFMKGGDGILQFGFNFLLHLATLTFKLVVFAHELQEAKGIVIVDGDISRRLISHVYFVSLLNQSKKSTTHRDDIIIGVGT